MDWIINLLEAFQLLKYLVFWCWGEDGVFY